ncbi:MAG TPA: hypothetical protein DHV85_11700, partial [Candidatus Accumulibacter sp.]|nr:hypothetical protein [Accumulibacter sp.]
APKSLRTAGIAITGPIRTSPGALIVGEGGCREAGRGFIGAFLFSEGIRWSRPWRPWLKQQF